MCQDAFDDVSVIDERNDVHNCLDLIAASTDSSSTIAFLMMSALGHHQPVASLSLDRQLAANSGPLRSTVNQSIAECQVGRFRLLGHDGFEDDVN